MLNMDTTFSMAFEYVSDDLTGIMDLMKNEIKKNDYLVKGHFWAKQLTVCKIKDRWLELIKN